MTEDRSIRRAWLALSLAALVVLAGANAKATSAPSDPTTAAPQTIEQRQAAEQLESWRGSMEQSPITKEGCFTADYPSKVWRQVQCVTAPDHPYRSVSIPRHTAPDFSASGPSIVGSGDDYAAATVAPDVVTSATGSFDKVIGVESEADGGNADTYSLQLNSNYFFTPACNTAADPSACLGWEQFVFEGSGGGFVQYWLINYAATCPSGWTTFGSSCFGNAGNAVSTPAAPITQLADIKLTGTAIAGGLDTITVSIGSSVYKATNPDSALSLAGKWTAAEFNLFGNYGGSQANLNSGVTIEVRTSLFDGSSIAPICEANGGTSGETNNLALGSCVAVGGSAPAIKFTESNPPGSIWRFTGAPCSGGRCKGWHELDNNGESVRIAATGSNLYQMWNTGAIWESTGTACGSSGCPGWKMIDNNGAAMEIVAGGENLYKLHNTGQIFTYTGSGWQMLDDNPAAITIAASTGNLYELHNTGNIWRYTGSPCRGSSCGGWQQLDGNKETAAIVTEQSNLYQLHYDGSVWKYTGTPCSRHGCPGWQLLNNNPNTTDVAASGGNLYELDFSGKIWRYTGTPCNGSSCTGWQLLDNNPAAMTIAADGSYLYELHSDGSLFRSTGAPCVDKFCTGWQQLDNNGWTGRIAVANGNLYQLHIFETAPSVALKCYECR